MASARNCKDGWKDFMTRRNIAVMLSGLLRLDATDAR